MNTTEYLDLVRQYRVTGVPTTVVIGRGGVLGALPEDEFIGEILKP